MIITEIEPPHESYASKELWNELRDGSRERMGN
jgi:hypothetical protein